MAITREAILATRTTRVENIGVVPGWEELGDFYVRQLTVKERNEWAAVRLAGLENEGAGAFGFYLDSRAHLFAFAVCDEDGNRLFDDVSQVYELDPKPVDYVALKAEEFNGLSNEAAETIQGN